MSPGTESRFLAVLNKPLDRGIPQKDTKDPTLPRSRVTPQNKGKTQTVSPPSTNSVVPNLASLPSPFSLPSSSVNFNFHPALNSVHFAKTPLPLLFTSILSLD